MAAARLIVAGASRPYPGETENGDAWQVDWHDGICRITVIDGLGHGPAAAAAARTAQQALASAPGLPPDKAIRLCHEALQGTRGAVLSVARIDPASSRLTYAGIGNIEARICQDAHEKRLITYRGIVGFGTLRVRSFDVDLGAGWHLVLYTDGIGDRFETNAILAEAGSDPQGVADALLAGWGRLTDDATIVVAQGGAPDR